MRVAKKLKLKELVCKSLYKGTEKAGMRAPKEGGIRMMKEAGMRVLKELI